MDYVWEIIQPYVLAVIAFLSGSGIVAVILRAVVKKLFTKNSATLEEAYNTEKVAQKVAEKLAGKTLNIDVTAVTEKALKKTAEKLDVRVEKVEVATNALKAILVAIAKGTIKLKALTDEEKTELASAIAQLEANYKPPTDNEIMTVKLAPISLPEDDADEEEEKPAAHDSGVNFGGLDTK